MSNQRAPSGSRGGVLPLILIALGVLFLIGELFDVRFGSSLWPFLIIVPGALMLAAAFGRRSVNAGLASAGAVLTALGLILLYQNVSDHWESWAYAWALLPLAAGVAQMAAGMRNEDDGVTTAGQALARTFGIVFIIGVVIFELVIFDRSGLSGYLLPLALIAVGAFLLWRHYERTGELPWGDAFQRQGPDAAASGRNDVEGTIVTPPPASAPEPTQQARPPTGEPNATATASRSETFPEDELPHSPPSDSDPFPTDEEAPAPPAEPPKPRRRTRSGGSRKTNKARQNPPDEA